MLVQIYDQYYNSKKEIFMKYFNLKEINISFINENDKHIIIIYTNKLKIMAEYEILGNYDVQTGIWIWSWANSLVEKNLVKIAEKIKSKSKYITHFNGEYDEIELVNYYITNPSFYISSNNMDMFVKMVLYYSDENWILQKKNKNFPSIFEFIIIKNILNIY